MTYSRFYELYWTQHLDQISDKKKDNAAEVYKEIMTVIKGQIGGNGKD